MDHANEAIHKEEKYRDDEEVIGPDDMIQPKEEERDVEMMNDERQVIESTAEILGGHYPYNDSYDQSN